MGCCLSTEAQVDLVIAQFAKKYAPFDALQSGNFPQLVAGRMVPVNTPFIAPVTGRKCVYYSVKAEELVHKTRHVKDAEGHEHVEHYTQWTYRYTDTRSSDFLLIDPGNPTIYIYIPFTQTNHKIHSERDGSAVNFPKGGQCNDHMRDMRGRYQFDHQEEWRYTEQCFEYGEEAAVIGVIRDATVPGGKMLNPMSKDMLTEEYFTNNEWSSWDKSSWEDLTKTPCIIVTDCAKFLENRRMAPLPQAYSLPPTFAKPMYIAGYAPPQQMGGNNSQVYPAAVPPQQMGGGGGYPPQGAAGGPGGYPPQQQGGYPPQQQHMGGGPGGYPPQGGAGGGYPPQGQQGGYPQGGGPGGYPPQQQGGYPPQGQGYPPQQGGGYPPQGQQGGYNQGGGYPQGGGPGGYPPQQQGGYPPQGQGYPPQQGGGYPPQGGGYPPQGQGGYPPQGGGYPQQVY